MKTLDELEWQWTLTSAVARFEELRSREALADPDDVADPNLETEPLTRDDSLELLALSEVIARKAGYGRQLTVRAARAAGASWAQIGEALGTSRQAAWESHTKWIELQRQQFEVTGYEGLDEDQAIAAEMTAGSPTDEDS